MSTTISVQNYKRSHRDLTHFLAIDSGQTLTHYRRSHLRKLLERIENPANTL